MIFSTDDLGKDYGMLLEAVVRDGLLSAPRGMPIREAIPLYLQLGVPMYCVADRKGFSKALMWLEIASMVAGEYRQELYDAVSPNAASMLSQQGAYGPRTRDQMEYVVQELQRDPDSRRAVVYVGRDTDLRYSQHFEQPCTMTWQFLLRNGDLHMVVNMRSWDLVWGLGYDVPCFVSIQRALAAALGAGVGTYSHVAGSGHVYKRHWDVADAVGPRGKVDDGLQMVGAYGRGDPLRAWRKTVRMASKALDVCDQILVARRGTLVAPPEWVPAAIAWERILTTGRIGDGAARHGKEPDEVSKPTV